MREYIAEMIESDFIGIFGFFDKIRNLQLQFGICYMPDKISILDPLARMLSQMFPDKFRILSFI